MLTEERLKNYPRHPSQRGEFAYHLYCQMAKNKDIILVLPDLGYGMFNSHCEDMPDQVINCGASEQGAMGLAVGLAMKGKIPFIFSITNFVVYRPFEWLRNYMDHEGIAVKILGGGRDFDYDDDGYTHTCCDVKGVLDQLPNILQFWPKTNDEIEKMCEEMVMNGKPSFISLTRK
jgi:transketolase